MQDTAADTIFSQLGGQKLVAMCGVRDLMRRDGGETLSFRVPASLTKRQINFVKIAYVRGLDLYNVEFGKIRSGIYRVLDHRQSVYASDLRKVFTEVTGLETSL